MSLHDGLIVRVPSVKSDRLARSRTFSTEPSTVAPSSTSTSVETTELRTVAPETIEPDATMDSCEIPPRTNFAGGRLPSSVEWIGHALL